MTRRLLSAAAAGALGLRRERAAEALAAIADPEEYVHRFPILLVAEGETLPEGDAAEVDAVGLERHGLPAEILAAADARVAIPMWGSVSSLNLAVATALVVYEVRRRRT